ncbi:MAG: phosphoribosylanthranilate isomerase [Candidatus Omnitrophota bacterium]
MVKVKICGITNPEDAKLSVKSGCDALGFVFYKKSPRYIAPEQAVKIIKMMPSEIIKIGVFANAREKTIRRIADFCGLDALQFHGSESPEFCRRFPDKKIIKAFRVKDKSSLKKVLKYKVFAFLFDTFSKAKIGGTGEKFDWNLVRHIDGITRPVFLSGGLNERNVAKAVKAVHPAWVDACTSLECSPGRKNHAKVKRFICAAKKC